MFTPGSDLEKLEKLLHSEEKCIAMLAPAFVVDFEFPEIVIKLRKLGFERVTELTFGAKIVSKRYYELLKNNPEKSYISSPCSTLVPLVLTQYPQLKEALAPILSPTVATARILKKYYPNHKIVFIGPCLTKKQEIKLFPDEVYLALTFRELYEYLEMFPVDGTYNPAKKKEAEFDKFYNDFTKVYPLAGGLAKTMHLKNILKADEYVVEDGLENEILCLKEYENRKDKIKFYDLLSCHGGCIGGPGIISADSLEVRHQKVEDYRNQAAEVRHELQEKDKIGKLEDAHDIDLSRTF